VIVSSVSPGSAAERAGVKRGDVIESFNGQRVHDTNTLRNRVAEAGPGKTAELVIVRDGGEKRVNVTLEEANPDKVARNRDRDDSGGGSDDKAALGVAVAPITPELRERARLPRDVEGLVVENVDPDGRAALAGLQPGDVIQEVNRQQVKTVDDLRAALKKSSDRPTLLLINRDGRDVFVTVRPANG
jgi:S1-C subfamily serine protease